MAVLMCDYVWFCVYVFVCVCLSARASASVSVLVSVSRLCICLHMFMSVSVSIFVYVAAAIAVAVVVAVLIIYGYDLNGSSRGYGVATISTLLKIIGLFCKRALQNRLYSAKETYNFKEPTNRSHPI